MRKQVRKTYDVPIGIIGGLTDEEASAVAGQYKSAKFLLQTFAAALNKRLTAILEEDEKEETIAHPNHKAKLEYNLGRRRELRRIIKMLPSIDN